MYKICSECLSVGRGYNARLKCIYKAMKNHCNEDMARIYTKFTFVMEARSTAARPASCTVG